MNKQCNPNRDLMRVYMLADELLTTIEMWEAGSEMSLRSFRDGYSHAISDLKRWQEIKNLQKALDEFKIKMGQPVGEAPHRPQEEEER